MHKAYLINLFGTFDVARQNGKIITPSSNKACALIALLATSSQYRRSRSWLKAMLWSEVDEARASASLRACLYELRKEIDGAGTFLGADRRDVWLEADLVDVIVDRSTEDEFLEGIDLAEEPFEDWLREKRANVFKLAQKMESATSRKKTAVFSSAGLPKIAIYPVAALAQEDAFHAELITDIIVKTLLDQRCIEVFDLRYLDACQFNPRDGSPTIALLPRMVSTGTESHFSLTMKDRYSGQVLWSRWFADIMCRGVEFAQDYFTKTIGEIANAVHDQVQLHCRNLQQDGMFSAIQNVLSHSKQGQDSARPWLSEAAAESGVARAWLMYTFAVGHAERHGGLGQEGLEELEEHCRLAHAAEPANPIVQAITGHINAFVFRRPDAAEIHHKTARKLGWNQPIVWTLSAMHANYTNRPETAYYYSSQAIAQSTFSPNRFYFEGPHSVSCSLTNRHDEAITIGESILAKKPGFLAVMRHLAASQVFAGRIEEARTTITNIRRKDPQFQRQYISASDYPLPSNRSVALIEQALTIAGMEHENRAI